MSAINKVVGQTKDVRVITAKGSDVTKLGFFREKLESDDDDESRNIDDIIIKTTKNHGEARRQVFKSAGKSDFGNAEPAILLTEDANMRVKANALGIPAISTTHLKKYLVQIGSQPSKRMPPARAIKGKQSIPQPSPRIKGDYDDDNDIYMGDSLQHGQYETKIPKRPVRERRSSRGGSTNIPSAVK